MPRVYNLAQIGTTSLSDRTVKRDSVSVGRTGGGPEASELAESPNSYAVDCIARDAGAGGDPIHDIEFQTRFGIQASTFSRA